MVLGGSLWLRGVIHAWDVDQAEPWPGGRDWQEYKTLPV
jgi:hypothetical protein